MSAAESCESEVIAQELESLGAKVNDLETRLADVERIIGDLETAALTTARALEEVSIALGLGVPGDAPRRVVQAASGTWSAPNNASCA